MARRSIFPVAIVGLLVALAGGRRNNAVDAARFVVKTDHASATARSAPRAGARGGDADEGASDAVAADRPRAVAAAGRRVPLALATAVAATAVAGGALAPGGADAFPLEARTARGLGGAAGSLSVGSLDIEEMTEDATATPLVTQGEEPSAAVAPGKVPDAKAGVAQPSWLATLREMGLENLEEKPGGKRFQASSTFSDSGKIEVEVVEIRSVADRRRALEAMKALDVCGGGDIVTFVRASSDYDSKQVVLPMVGEVGSVFFVTDAPGADLSEVLAERGSGTMNPAVKYRILVEVLRGLSKMKAAGFAHRSVDPHSVKIVGECSSMKGCDAKLGGLGHAGHFDPPAPAAAWGARPAYIAPEVWTSGASQRKADVWSVGMLAYEMFVGELPGELQGDSPDARTTDFDVNADERLREFQLEDPETALLIRKMLRRSVLWRPSIARSLRMAQAIAQSRKSTAPELRLAPAN